MSDPDLTAPANLEMRPAFSSADFPNARHYLLHWRFAQPQSVGLPTDPALSKGVVVLTIEEDERRQKRESHGFTHEDVRLIEFVASFEPQDYPDVPKLRSLASRISALLPPEPIP